MDGPSGFATCCILEGMCGLAQTPFLETKEPKKNKPTAKELRDFIGEMLSETESVLRMEQTAHQPFAALSDHLRRRVPREAKK
jgi:hypothetical protein